MYENGYKFIFKYDDDNDNIYELPLTPEVFITKVSGKNKIIELISIGEANILKDIALRDFNFKIYLPDDISFINEKECIEETDQKFNKTFNSAVFKPIVYLAKFREFKASKKPIRFIITRIMPNGERIFDGNLLVSFENYTVEEKAGDEGNFWVNIELKEYREIKPIITVLSDEKTKDGKIKAENQVQRAEKEISKTYTVAKGDNLWKIAKLYLNDGSRYKEIAEINNILNPEFIKTGDVLKLP